MQLHAGGVQVERTGQNFSHTRYLPMLEFQLIFRSGTRAVSVILDTGKQCKVVPLCSFSQFRRRLNFQKLLVGAAAPSPIEQHLRCWLHGHFDRYLQTALWKN